MKHVNRVNPVQEEKAHDFTPRPSQQFHQVAERRTFGPLHSSLSLLSSSHCCQIDHFSDLVRLGGNGRKRRDTPRNDTFPFKLVLSSSVMKISRNIEVASRGIPN